MHLAKLPRDHQVALLELLNAARRCRNLGFNVLYQASLYADKSMHALTGILTPYYRDGENGPEPPVGSKYVYTPLDHVFADAVRDLSVEWSNEAHAHDKHHLVWRKKQ